MGKFIPLVWAGLWRKPWRTVLTLLSIVAAFILFGVLLGVDAGIAQLVERQRLDRLMITTRFGAPLPLSYAAEISRIDGVKAVAPFGQVAGQFREPGTNAGVLMSDARVLDVWPEVQLSPAQFAQLESRRTGIFVTQAMAERLRWKAGDRIPLETRIEKRDGSKVWEFDILAVIPDVDPVPNGFALGAYSYLDEGRITNNGTVGIFHALVADPARAEEIGLAIDRHFASSAVPTRTIAERAQAEVGLQSTVDMGFFTKTIIAAGLFMLLSVTGNVMAQSVRERIPEFAVLMTIGFSPNRILALVLAEGIIPCFFGAALGLGLAQIAVSNPRAVLPPGMIFPAPQFWTPVLISGAGIALFVVLASAIPAVTRLRRLSVVGALTQR